MGRAPRPQRPPPPWSTSCPGNAPGRSLGPRGWMSVGQFASWAPQGAPGGPGGQECNDVEKVLSRGARGPSKDLPGALPGPPRGPWGPGAAPGPSLGPVCGFRYSGPPRLANEQRSVLFVAALPLLRPVRPVLRPVLLVATSALVAATSAQCCDQCSWLRPVLIVALRCDGLSCIARFGWRANCELWSQRRDHWRRCPPSCLPGIWSLTFVIVNWTR